MMFSKGEKKYEHGTKECNIRFKLNRVRRFSREKWKLIYEKSRDDLLDISGNIARKSTKEFL